MATDRGILQTQGRTETIALNPPPTEDEILAAEKALSIERFPEDFRCSLKRHNGQKEGPTLLGIGYLLPLHEIVDNWGAWKGLLDDGTFADNDDYLSRAGAVLVPVKANWWNPCWIPITHDGGGDHDCLDLDPAAGGAVGQIIEMWHDDDTRPLNASSFEAWLSACAEDLEQGRLVWEADYGGFSKPDPVSSQPNNLSELEGCS